MSSDISKYNSIRKKIFRVRVKKSIEYYRYERDINEKIINSWILTKKQYLDYKFKEEVDRAYKIFSEQLQLEKYSSPEPITISKTTHPIFSKLNQFTSVANLLLFAMVILLLIDTFSYSAIEHFFESKLLFHFLNIVIAVSILFCLFTFNYKSNGLQNKFLKNQFIGAGLFLGFLLAGTAKAQNVTGRVIEEGSNYGVPKATIELYINNNKTPKTTTTNNSGEFNTNITGITQENPTIPETFYIQNNYPNPFNKETNIKFGITQPENITISIYTITGEEILKENYTLNSGHYNYKINELKNIANQPLIILFNSKNIHEAKKIMKIGNKTNNNNTRLEKSSGEYESLQKNTDTWQLDSIKISGETLEQKTLTENTTQTGDFNIGNIEVKGTNIITGYTYDLDTKYTNRTGIPNLEIRIKSIPEKTVTTNNQGIFTYNTTRTGNDSLFINSNEYYNWKHPINITKNTEVKAFNDNTGIPMIKRYTDTGRLVYYDGTQWIDTLTTEDLIEFTQKITSINFKWVEDPIYKNTVNRFKNDTVLVYLNRQNSPIGYYPDSSLAGLKYLETGNLRFIETNDSASAQIHMKYTNANVGNGENIQYGFDEQGPYLKNWDINIRGPPSPFLLEPQYVAPVVAHEAEHAIFTTGEHSPYQIDLISQDPISRYGFGYPTIGSEKEIRTRKILSHTERNPKLLEYYK